jgi:hypothetical protein
MRKHSILAAFAFLLAFLAVPALVSAAAPPAHAQAAPASAPSLGAFLASLDQPAAAAVPAAGCGTNFCTQAQRDACDQQCRSHGHSIFVGLECCRDCTTLCICGSRPVNC